MGTVLSPVPLFESGTTQGNGDGLLLIPLLQVIQYTNPQFQLFPYDEQERELEKEPSEKRETEKEEERENCKKKAIERELCSAAMTEGSILHLPSPLISTTTTTQKERCATHCVPRRVFPRGLVPCNCWLAWVVSGDEPLKGPANSCR